MGDELTPPFHDTRRFPSDRTVARTEDYTHAAKFWALSIVQGPFSVTPVPNPNVTIRNFFIAVTHLLLLLLLLLASLVRALLGALLSVRLVAAVAVVGIGAVQLRRVALLHDGAVRDHQLLQALPPGFEVRPHLRPTPRHECHP